MAELLKYLEESGLVYEVTRRYLDGKPAEVVIYATEEQVREFPE